MTKGQLADAVASKMGLSKKQAEETIDATFDVIAKTMIKDDKVNVPGFGIFRVSSRKAREGINPKTGEKIHIPAKKAAKFRAAKALKEAVM